jgi:hypothetical protein
MAVCLAVVRGLISIEQGRQALHQRTAATPASGLLGLDAPLRKEAAVPAQLRGEEISACLSLLERLLPERSGEEILQEEETLAQMLVDAGRLSREEVDEYIGVQKRLVESGQRPLPGLTDLLHADPSSGAEGPSRVPRIPGYQLTGKIGNGAMGAVFKARQTTLDRWVAVKVLKRALAQDLRFIEQFQKEARTAGKLRHENIVSALDCGQADGEYYLIMEYAEGLPLSRILKERGKLPEEEALGIALQIARGLDYAWEHRIIHRDIKSENILLSPQKVVKICDLGLCRDAGAVSAGREGFACTPSYASPEQARRDRELDCRTDIYSLGIVLYQMVTGSLPFQGKPLEILAKHMTEPPAAPQSRNPSVSAGLNRLILDMIEKDKAKRPQSPKDVIQRIEALLAPSVRPSTARAGTTRAGRTSVTTRRKVSGETRAGVHRTPFLAWAGAAAVLAVGVFFLVKKSNPEEHPPALIRRPLTTLPPAPETKAEPAARPTPSAAALKTLQALESSSKPPHEILFACEESRKIMQGTPEEPLFRELEERALHAGKEEKSRHYLDQVRKMIDQDPTFNRSAEILRMLRLAGSGGPELETLRIAYETRFDRAARQARDGILEVALPLRDQKRFNDALALIRGYPEGFRSSKYGPDLEKLAQDIDREWSAQISSEQGRSRWAGWKIPWGENGHPPSVLPSKGGRPFVLVTASSADKVPFALEHEFSIPEEGAAVLSVGVAAEPGESWELRVSVQTNVLKRQVIGKRDGDWEEILVDLSTFQGRSVRIRLEAKAIQGQPKACYWSEIDLQTTK